MRYALLLTALLACSKDEEPVDTWDPNAPLAERCFAGIGDPEAGVPEYDAFGPVVPRHCAGTNHQDIAGVERVVFLGDSITAGTPPTHEVQYYRTLLTERLRERFGDVQVDDCSEWGAENVDFMGGGEDAQLTRCFPDAVEPRVTLAIWTMGGNDMFALAQDFDAGLIDVAGVDAGVDASVAQLAETLQFFRDPVRFPAGAHVVFGNLYEYTDASGDLSVCPTATILGFAGVIPEIRDAYVRINEEYVRLAVETGTDVLFLLEHFCGHGFLADDPTNECYRGADTEVWFDGTCIHPTPAGHAQIADQFTSVIDE